MEEQATKKTVLSGIQPTSRLTLGNYLGALKNFVAMQEEFDFDRELRVLGIHRDPTAADAIYNVERNAACPPET